MAESVDRRYPNPVLTQLSAQESPTFATLQVLKQELCANAMAIPSSRGGGAKGHLALVMTDAEYLTAAGVAFNAPVHPGDAPVHAAGATSAQITETNRQYKAQLKEFETYTAVETALKAQLVEAVPDTFINALSDKYVQYGATTVQALLQHLFDTYGTVTPDDLLKNEQEMEQPWSPEQPLEDLFKQIRLCREFAQDHDEISDNKAVRSALNNLEQSGVFTEDIRTWRQKSLADRTWTNFIPHFMEANKERKRQLTTRDLGYHAHVTDKTEGQEGVSETTKAQASKKPSDAIEGFYYCWSHGLGPNPNHTSTTCNKRAEGHRTDATIKNMMGGCNMIHRRRGERAIFKPANTTTTESE